mmetsp:Transcript_4909/g.12310  ORF Transcript_4909/g.12310 Transcript_4909/m.12310 type:complete len:293 (-) Transcript_4909:254-1132(-)
MGQEMDGTAEVPIGGGLLPLERPHQRGGVLGIVLAGAVHCKLGHLCHAQILAVGQVDEVLEAVRMPQRVLARPVGAAHDGDRGGGGDAHAVGQRVTQQRHQHPHPTLQAHVVAVQRVLREVGRNDGAALEHQRAVLHLQQVHEHLQRARLTKLVGARGARAQQDAALQDQLRHAGGGLQRGCVHVCQPPQELYNVLHHVALCLCHRHWRLQLLCVRQKLQAVLQLLHQTAHIVQDGAHAGQMAGSVQLGTQLLGQCAVMPRRGDAILRLRGPGQGALHAVQPTYGAVRQQVH